MPEDLNKSSNIITGVAARVDCAIQCEGIPIYLHK